MPVLAIRTADHYNGVSALHGEVSRKMWQRPLARAPEHEVPIESITNGVHTASWIAREMGALFTRYLGPRWAERRDDAELWARVARDPRRRAVAGARAPPPSPGAARAPLAARAPPSAAAPAREELAAAPTRCSIRARSPSASRAASRRTSARRCSSATSSA